MTNSLPIPNFKTVCPNWVGLGRAQTHQQQNWDREESEGDCLGNGTCLESLLACNGESEELEEAGDDSKTLEIPAAILGVVKKPATNWKTLEMTESLEELEKPTMLKVLEKSETLEELEKPTTTLETL